MHPCLLRVGLTGPLLLRPAALGLCGTLCCVSVLLCLSLSMLLFLLQRKQLLETELRAINARISELEEVQRSADASITPLQQQVDALQKRKLELQADTHSKAQGWVLLLLHANTPVDEGRAA